MLYPLALALVAVLALLFALPQPPRVPLMLIGVPVFVVIMQVGCWAASRTGIVALGLRAPDTSRLAVLVEALAIGFLLGSVLLVMQQAKGLTLSAPAPGARWFTVPIVAEVVCRLFLMSVVACGLSRFARLSTDTGRAAVATVWAANLLVGILVASVHVTTWLLPDSGPESFRGAVFGLQWLASVVVGGVYLRRGIEASVITHIACAAVLHGGSEVLSWP